jgi:hypothetical protein
MELVKQIIIPDLPKKTLVGRTEYLLTANIFYSGINHYVRSTIIKRYKDFLYTYLSSIPKINKLCIELDFYDNAQRFDLDNKGFFWEKLILDCLRKDSKVIKNDTVKYCDEIKKRFFLGDNKLIISLYEKKE